MTESAMLVDLARTYGLSTSYVGAHGPTVHAEPEVLAAILESLGARTADPEAALRERQRAEWTELIEPVTVVWAGRGWLRVRLPVALRAKRFEIELVGEVGTSSALTRRLGEAPIVSRDLVAGVEFATRRLALPALQTGYYRARIRAHHEGGTSEGDTLILSAPRQTYAPAEPMRATGVFAPLYAIQTDESLGIGSLGDLGRLLRWTRVHGGATVGTLPLLATYHDDPEGVSPYSPVSRLAWDELFLDLHELPELGASARAQAALMEARAETSRLHKGLVDYRAVEEATKPLLTALADEAFAPSSSRRDALAHFAAAHPLVADYARFRGARARLGGSWRQWPALPRSGALDESDIDAVTHRVHLYAQFALEEQLAALGAEARRGGAPGLYLDLSVGTHRAGFDAWRFPEAFADELDTGAPPDIIATEGQNWHFAPGHPEGLRRSGYRYFIESVRTHLRHAGILRVDHVMGLHRLWVMPRGAQATAGAYLNYRPDEAWAILAIESVRARSVVVGEDLGTVPATVRAAMRRHGVGSSWVLQYEVRPKGRALSEPPRLSVAALNTHDMPTFAGWLDGEDIATRSALGLLAVEDEPAARAEREAMVSSLRRFFGLADDEVLQELLGPALRSLGASEAGLVLVALADLLGERRPDNVPGTTVEHANWRRRLAISLDDLERASDAAALLRTLALARGGDAGRAP